VRGLKSVSLAAARCRWRRWARGAHGARQFARFHPGIALKDFQTSDIELLSEALNLTDTAGVTLNALERARLTRTGLPNL
jgi:hypothetical protein